MPDLIRHSAPVMPRITKTTREKAAIAGVQVTIKQEPEVSPSLHTAKPVSKVPHPLRCPEIPETTPFTSAKPTTDPSHPLRWTKQAQTSRLHCRKRRADSAPGYPTKRVGASVRQKNGGFYDGRYRNPLILSHFRNRPTGFQAF